MEGLGGFPALDVTTRHPDFPSKCGHRVDTPREVVRNGVPQNHRTWWKVLVPGVTWRAWVVWLVPSSERM